MRHLFLQKRTYPAPCRMAQAHRAGRPRVGALRARREDRHLQRGTTIEELAGRCGIDPFALAQTISQYNEHARRGEDPQFGRGSTPYNRKQGDALHAGPNPCVAPIEHGPFYAVKVRPGSFGTFAGLNTNEHAQVLDAHGEAMPDCTQLAPKWRA